MDGTTFPQQQSASATALATGRDVIGELVGLRMPDGELRWISVNARALRDGDVITGVVSTFVDVTEQQAVVAALAESEKRFRLLAENASDLITSIDAEGVRTYVSPSCRVLLGYEPEELIGELGDRDRAPWRSAAHHRLPPLRARARAGEGGGALPPQERSLGLDGDPRARRARRRRQRRRAADGRARHHGRAPRRGRAARGRGALPQRLRPGSDRQGARLDRWALHARQRGALPYHRVLGRGPARHDLPVAHASGRPRRRPRGDESPARRREPLVRAGEALPARRRALHLGAAERVDRARRSRHCRATSCRRSRTSASRSSQPSGSRS